MRTLFACTAALYIAAFAAPSFSLAQETKGQLTASQELFEEIAAMDRIVFAAFNTRDTETFKAFFNEDLEFYHDKDGLSGYDKTVQFPANLLREGNDLKRDLVDGTLEVYPLGDYGALEIGVHEFCHTENGRQDCGTFKFTHVWQRRDEQWKISRIISYDH